jgi:hypothetical protein
MRAASVDWRNRWGWNWISSTRNQAGAPNCWAFAATALYEAMVRIEHCVWCRRSEGDAARGAGKQAWDLGNVGEVSIFVERYGLADPDCFPWSTAASIYSAKPHGAALSALPLSPTPDRAGRTLRMPAGHLTALADVEQKKTWIDAVGPMAVMVDPPGDFGALGPGIYTTVGPGAGMHALLVVGYDDPDRVGVLADSGALAMRPTCSSRRASWARVERIPIPGRNGASGTATSSKAATVAGTTTSRLSFVRGSRSSIGGGSTTRPAFPGTQPRWFARPTCGGTPFTTIASSVPLPFRARSIATTS